MIGQHLCPISGRLSDSNRDRSACGRLAQSRRCLGSTRTVCPLYPLFFPGRCTSAPPACRQDGSQADLLLRQVLRRALRVSVSGPAGRLGRVFGSGQCRWSGQRRGWGSGPELKWWPCWGRSACGRGQSAALASPVRAQPAFPLCFIL